jgi:hypothetical protein
VEKRLNNVLFEVREAGIFHRQEYVRQSNATLESIACSRTAKARHFKTRRVSSNNLVTHNNRTRAHGHCYVHLYWLSLLVVICSDYKLL